MLVDRVPQAMGQLEAITAEEQQVMGITMKAQVEEQLIFALAPF
jgi:hypothetical protein